MAEPDGERVRAEHRYELLTWPEIKLAVAQEKVVVLPIAAVEQHGHHLPLDVDNRLVTEIALGAGSRSPADMLVLPPVHFGYCHHVMDLPGTITIEPTTFVNVLHDIGKSVAHHGFKRMIMINGHGSNAPLVELAARQTLLQTGMLCASLSWWQLIAQYWNTELRESVNPGGSAHACELETSVYMHLNPDGVRMDRIKGAVPDYMTMIPGAEKWHWIDLTGSNGPMTMVEWTGSISETGALGQPELATAEKGSLVFERAVSELVELAQWLRTRPTFPRNPRQEGRDGSELTFDL